MELLRKTNQGAFDFVVRRLYNGKGPAIENGSCVYRRSTDNNKCAVGCLIPDKYYDPRMEGKTVYVVFKDWLDYDGNVSIKLLNRLQEIHDGDGWNHNAFVEHYWLYRVAENFNLNTKVLDKFTKKA
jgi:hypothetical protein